MAAKQLTIRREHIRRGLNREVTILPRFKFSKNFKSETEKFYQSFIEKIELELFNGILTFIAIH